MPPLLSQVDPLSEVLGVIKLKSVLLERSQLAAPWGFHVPVRPDGAPEFPPGFMIPPGLPKPPPASGWMFAVLSGSCWLEVQGGGEPIHLTAGSVAVVTQPKSHTLRDEPHTPARLLWEVLPPPPMAFMKNMHQPISLAESLNPSCKSRVRPLPAVQLPGPGPTTQLLTAILFVEEGQGRRLLAAFPPVIHLSREQADGAGWVPEVLAAVEREAQNGQAGAVAVVSRLTHVLFDHALRSYLSGVTPGNTVPLSAQMDEEIGQVLRLVHEKPGHPWTVQSLADHVAMSRSTFALRFHELVGQPPLKYLTDYRLHLAAELLRSESMAIKEVAAQVGYESLASFCNAFKRMFHTSPGVYRKAPPAVPPQA